MDSHECSQLDNINKLTASGQVIAERLDNWMSATVEHRRNLCEKLDRIMSQVEMVNQRCFNRTEDYILFNQHLKLSRDNKSFMRDKKFWIIGSLFVISYQVIFSLFMTNLVKKDIANAKVSARTEAVAGENKN